jgi:hypothetical protein
MINIKGKCRKISTVFREIGNESKSDGGICSQTYPQVVDKLRIFTVYTQPKTIS